MESTKRRRNAAVTLSNNVIMAKAKLTAAQRKNLKKKEQKARRRAADAVKTEPQPPVVSNVQPDDDNEMQADLEDVEIEYVVEEAPTAAAEAFGDVFERFAAMGRDDEANVQEVAGDADDADDESDEEEKPNATKNSNESKLTRKERKRQRLQSVGVLKQLVARPDVVEVWDATAPDPEFLVYLKAYRNTVTVPRHWCRKKRYLQAKRGVDKKPFELPEFIQATGIARLREAYVEREEMKKLKQKSRERVQPKMGKMDINYTVLHDAFFKHQKKPENLTTFGDMYYEGREFETNLSAQRPGVLSAELKLALGMTSPLEPPPFLFNMQRVGPPPSYPNLKIPGLNAPIPAGCTYGYGAGQWGQPPLDDYRRPLYGDVFGTAPVVETPQVNGDRAHWGDIADDSESDSDDDSSDDSEGASSDDDAVEMAQDEPTPADDSGFASTASGLTSVTGIDTPDALALRKTGLSTPGSSAGQRGDGFTVLQPIQASVGDALMGTTHTYALPSGTQTPADEPVPEMNLSKRKASDAGGDKKRLKF